MDSVYSTGPFGSVLPDALNSSFSQYQISSDLMPQFPSSLEPPPPPPPPFFNYGNSVKLPLGHPHSVAAGVSVMGPDTVVGRVGNNVWTQPPPPPPPPFFSTPFDGSVQSTRPNNFLSNPTTSSTGYTAVNTGVHMTNEFSNFRRIIEPPPPPPVLLTTVQTFPLHTTENDGILTIGGENSAVYVTSDENGIERILTKRSHFTGTLCKLPENSRRPQVAEGRTFPTKVRGVYLPYNGPKGGEKDLHHYPGSSYPHNASDLSVEQERPVILTATKFVRKLPLPHNVATNDSLNTKAVTNATAKKDADSKSGRSSVEVLIEPLPGTSEEHTLTNVSLMKKAASSGTLSRNGMSWRRRKSNEEISGKAEVPQLFVKKKGNFRLRRIKDQLFTEDSNECYEFVEYGSCTSGVFCIYDHNGDSSHRTAKICARLLKGRCRKINCKYPHTLQPHQLPVCDYYLRRICTEENCQFLHVKHADSAKPCDQFNRGICKLGDDCSFPHRYFRAVIAKRGQEVNSFDAWVNDAVSDDDRDSEDHAEGNSGVLQWPI